MITRTIHLYRNAFSGLSRDIWMLALITLVNRAGTMVIPFMTVYLTQERHFSLAQAGYVMSCFGVGSILGNLLGGRLTDTVGYYHTQFWTLFISGGMFLLLGQMNTLPQMCVSIFFLSLIADAFRPANFASVAVYSRPENRTRSYSLLRLAVNLGFAVGPALGGWIAHWMGYEWLFWVDGLTCMGAALLYRFFLRRKYEESDDLQPEAKARPVQSAYRDRLFLIFVFFITLTAIAFMQFFSTIPVFFKEVFGFSEGQIGSLLALNGLLVAILEMPTVYRLEGRTPKIYLISLGAFLVGLSYLLYLLFDPWPGIAAIAVTVITLGEIFNMPFANALAVERSTPRNRGQYMALYSVSYSIALVIAPTIGLQIAGAYGFPALLEALCGLSLIAVIGFLSLRKKL